MFIGGILGGFHVNAVAHNVGGGELAALHLEILADVHRVGLRASHMERAEVGLEECVFVGGEGVLGVARQRQRTAARKFGIPATPSTNVDDVPSGRMTLMRLPF